MRPSRNNIEIPDKPRSSEPREIEPRLQYRPGLILGPYESLQAILMCMSETMNAANEKGHSLPSGLRKIAPRVNYNYRQRLLRAFLLFGYFDALSGMSLVDKYLLLHGRMESRREIFDEILQGYRTHSPFAHALDSAGFTYRYPLTAAASDADAERFAPAIIRALKRTGYTVEMKKHRPSDRLRYSHEAYKNEVIEELRFVAQMSRKIGGGIIEPYLNTLVYSCFAMLDRAILLECPLFSADAVGPTWISNYSVERPIEVSIQILKIVWEEVGWLPQPTSFEEARSMLEDDKVHGLRSDIQLWSQKIAVGDIGSEQELQASIKERMKWFIGKSWATKTSRFITYVAAPIGVAELLVSGGMIGLSVTGLGIAVQLISDKLEANKKKHWLSMGSDCL